MYSFFLSLFINSQLNLNLQVLPWDGVLCSHEENILKSVFHFNMRNNYAASTNEAQEALGKGEQE